MLHRKTFRRQDFNRLLYVLTGHNAVKSVFKKGKNKALFKLKEKHWLRVVFKTSKLAPHMD